MFLVKIMKFLKFVIFVHIKYTGVINNKLCLVKTLKSFIVFVWE